MKKFGKIWFGIGMVCMLAGCGTEKIPEVPEGTATPEITAQATATPEPIATPTPTAAPKPTATGWLCACGATNQGKFCQECGAKKPATAPLYKCDKCGWAPEDPSNPPKFCPECGDIFDENDAK